MDGFYRVDCVFLFLCEKFGVLFVSFVIIEVSSGDEI